MNETQQYLDFIRPEWAPPSWVFGPVWTILYVIILVSFGWVFARIWQRKIPILVGLPFAINLLANGLFTPIQFGLQNQVLAFIDLVVVWVTIIWAMIVIWPYARWVALAQIPYLAWVTFAGFLQWSIMWLNL